MASSKPLSDVDRNIINALAEGPLTTPELKELVGESAYRRCRRLEDLGLLKSTMSVRYVLFCVECWEVVTQENHQDHEDHEDQLRNIPNNVRKWALTEKGQQEVQS